MDSGGFSSFTIHFCTMTIIFFSMLFLEIANTVKSLATTLGLCRDQSSSPPINWYLKLVSENYPAMPYKSQSKSEFVVCAVCICKLEEGVEMRELSCKHAFHKCCLDKWLEHKGASCPLCRSPPLQQETLMAHWGSKQKNNGEQDLSQLISPFHGNSFNRLWSS